MFFQTFSKKLSKDERLARLREAAQTQYFWQIIRLVLGGAGSQDSKPTRSATRDLEVLGAISTLQTAKIKLTAGGRNYTQNFVPARSLFNLQGANLQYVPFPAPIIVKKEHTLNLEVQNSVTPLDAAGTHKVVFFSREKIVNNQNSIAEAEKWINDGRTSEPLIIPMNFDFTSTLNEEREQPTLTTEKPLLCVGVSSEFNFAEFEITQTWNNIKWSDSLLPVWAFSGATRTAFMSTWLFPFPFLIPAGGQFLGKAKNVGSEAKGSLNFHCITP